MRYTEAIFLPGLQLENGAIIIDPEKLFYPGDIIHEAGHWQQCFPMLAKPCLILKCTGLAK